MILTRDQRYAFVADEYSGAVSVFDFARTLAGRHPVARLLGAITVPPHPIALALSKTETYLYIASTAAFGEADQSGSLSIVSVHDAITSPGNAAGTKVRAGCSPTRIISSPDGKLIWLTARASNAVLAFDAAKLASAPLQALRAVVRVGPEPVDLALVRRGRFLLVGNSNRSGAVLQAQTLSVVDTAGALAHRRALIGTIRAGAFPRAIRVLPDGTVLVANYYSKNIEEFSSDRLP